MKKLVLIFLFSGVYLLNAQQNRVEAPLHLQSVTVYRQSAQLDYTAETLLPAGHVSVVFPGLSPYLVRESLQLEGLGKAEIIDMKFRNNFLINKRNKKIINDLKKKLSTLEAKINALESRQEALKGEKNILKVNAKLDKYNLTNLKNYTAYYTKRILAIDKQLFDLDNQMNPLLDQQDKLKKQISDLTAKYTSKTVDFIVGLRVPGKTRAHFRLKFLTRNVSWKPVYIVRTEGLDRPLSWEMKAEVTQHTGLDWENVPVHISTLQPHNYMQLPKPDPFYLNIRQRPVYRRTKVVALAYAEADNSASEKKMEYTPVETEESDVDIQYTLKGRYNVLSGVPATLHLKTLEVPVDYVYYAVPYKNRQAFLRVKIDNPSQYDLIPGHAQLYFAGRYVGKTNINPYAEKMALAFGIDPQIKVDYKRTKNYHQYNLTGGKVTVKRTYVISVENFKKKPVHIVIRDRVPVSMDKKITVKNVTTDGGTTDEKGIVTWDKTLAPGEKITLRLHYEVRYPKGVYIPGL